jgi:hypothetical protein
MFLCLSAATGPSVAAEKPIILQFPRQSSVGVLTRCQLNKNRYKTGESFCSEESVAAARGRIALPNGSHIGLQPNSEFYRHLEFLKGLPADAFEKITVRFRPATDDEDVIFAQALKNVSQLKGLKQLVLKNSDASDDILLPLNNLHELLWLDVSLNDVDGRFLSKLNNLKKLEVLILDETSFKQDNLKYLSNFPALRRLDAGNCFISDSGLALLIASCPHLFSLELNGNPKITDSGVAKLANLKGLKQVSLAGTSASIKGLKLLSKLDLEGLWLSEKGFSEQEIVQMKKLFPHAKIHFDSTGKVDDFNKQMFAPLH